MSRSISHSINVAPDGGWGWIVCFAFALSHIIILPIIQSFGLIYHKTFKTLGLTLTDATVLFNTNSSFGMMVGIANGPLLKHYGYRKIAITGGFLAGFGFISTAFADKFQYFFVCYGLITSLGFGLVSAAFPLALNSYFDVKRGLATGLAMTGMGLGPIVMPLIINVLLDYYGTTGCMLLLGGISLNIIVAACLLQPVEWHRPKIIEYIGKRKSSVAYNKQIIENLILKDIFRKEHHDCGTDIFTLSKDYNKKPKSINYKCAQIAENKLLSTTLPAKTKVTFPIDLCGVEYKDDTVAKKLQKLEVTCFRKIVDIFDLDLLKDPLYITLIIGMSVSIFAEINFTLLTPYILRDLKLSNFEIAQLMSIIALSDIVFRLASPFIAETLEITPKCMCVFSLFVLVASRTALIFTKTYFEIRIVAIVLGAAKGFRIVFMSLLIPNYVPIDKLATASGMQTLTNGIINMLCGPILGVIRESTGNFNICILVINGITLIAFTIWLIEIILIHFKKMSLDKLT